MTTKDLIPFKKGDPRINRKGRPKSFDALRQLAQQIAHETAKGISRVPGEAGVPIIIEGHTVTVTEMIMRSWAMSKDPRLVQAFIQYAYGKVPDDVNLNAKVKSTVTIKGVDYRTIASNLAPGPIQDSDTPGEDQGSVNGTQVG